MAKRINTDLGINVSLTDAPDVKTVSITNPPKIEGKNNFEVLADVLGQFNPKIQELVKKDVQEKDLQDEILGANTVNGLTLEEARQAHEKGFPDIYNGWARVGAYRQYALNANMEFSERMKQRYNENKNNPNYNWQQDYAELSQFYLKDKQNDPFFQAAFQKISPLTQKFITEEEFSLAPAVTTVISAQPDSCTQAFDFDELTLTLAAPLTNGNYELIINNGTDANSLLDICGRPIPPGDKLTFTYFIPQPIS